MNVKSAIVWLYVKNIRETPTAAISVFKILARGSLTPGPNTVAKLPSMTSAQPV